VDVEVGDYSHYFQVAGERKRANRKSIFP